MYSNEQIEELRQKRQYGIGRMLLLARKDFVTRLLATMEDRAEELPPSAAALLPYIDLEGTRGTELARRMGVSKQAAGKAVRDLESAGLVTRISDSADARAFLVKFSPQGMRYMMKLHEAIETIEGDYAELLGAENARILRDSLCKIAYHTPLP